jgi:hypothetical protein
MKNDSTNQISAQASRFWIPFTASEDAVSTILQVVEDDPDERPTLVVWLAHRALARHPFCARPNAA